jgi:thiosulfate/3-mercaptopyruvate sulfurtransferase
MTRSPRQRHLVQVDELADRLPSVRLLDVRWRLSDAPGDGGRRYAEGHLPGARFLDLEEVLTSHTGDPLDGRHPLPDTSTLAEGLGALGVRPDDDLVVYDEPGSFAAERAWWVLRWAGLRARVLDGGIDAWVDSGRPLETGESSPAAPTRLDLTVGQLPTIDVDAAATFAADGVLVDARAGERYRGEVEPLDPRRGHVPGAVNVSAATLYEDGRMPTDDRLRELLSPALGPILDRETPVAAYCGSGVSAARDVLALAVLGVDAALFPGSWSAWSNDPRRAAALGAQPGTPTLDSRP